VQLTLLICAGGLSYLGVLFAMGFRVRDLRGV
jgi:hypothetical protein